MKWKAVDVSFFVTVHLIIRLFAVTTNEPRRERELMWDKHNTECERA